MSIVSPICTILAVLFFALGVATTVAKDRYVTARYRREKSLLNVDDAMAHVTRSIRAAGALGFALGLLSFASNVTARILMSTYSKDPMLLRFELSMIAMVDAGLMIYATLIMLKPGWDAARLMRTYLGLTPDPKKTEGEAS